MKHNAFLVDVLGSEELSTKPGAVIATIGDDGSEISAAGLADIENPAVIGSESLFHVASVAKQFTGFVTAKLIYNRKLSLDTRIGDILDWLNAPLADCKIRHLLFHTSGIRDNWSLSEFSGLRDGDSILTSDVRHWLENQDQLNFQPGTNFLYSNSGYVLLALSIEAMEGDSFGRIVRKNIFDPLGMLASFFVEDPARAFQKRVRGYEPETSGYRLSDPNYGVIGATGLRTSATDMLAWLSEPLDGSFFRDVESVGYLRPGFLDDGTPLHYGFGLIHANLSGTPVLMHGGYDYGFNAITIREVEGRKALFAASNGATRSTEPVATRLFSNAESAAEPRSRQLELQEPTILEGMYSNDDHSDVRVVKRVDGRLKLIWMQEFDLIPLDEMTFRLGSTALKLRSSPDRTSITIDQPHGKVTLNHIDEDKLDITRLVGTYMSVQLEALMFIETSGENTTVRIGRGPTFQLEPASETVATFGTNWMQVVSTDSKIENIVVSQPRCLGVEFRRI